MSLLHPFDQFRSTAHYIASDDLRHAVNTAIALERPLLLRGEPGTGKTMLAQNVASALELALRTWHVKSTTKAKDGLYVYDTIARLNDSRFGNGKDLDIKHYIRLGALGEALRDPMRSVLLIDEIDKADIEFPNDLLHELDAMRFVIEETGERVQAAQRPILLITSNNEKELPDAFLRRCVFHFIEFPTPALMRDIVRVHFPTLEDQVLSQAIDVFFAVRNTPRLRKRPSTSELIDWLAVLQRAGMSPPKGTMDLPFLGALLKTEQDLALLRRTKA